MFRIYLQVSEQAPRAGSAEGNSGRYRPELDNVLSLLDDLCEALAETQRAVFWVEGFGQSPWPVDVATDLSVCLSELPKVANWLRHGGEGQCEWWFFEQGIERKLVLSLEGEQIRIRCVSFGDWKPSPEVEFLAYHLLWAMLRDLVRVFHEQARALCPRIVAHEWFQQWHKSVELE
jgi:hypothetical protein